MYSCNENEFSNNITQEDMNNLNDGLENSNVADCAMSIRRDCLEIENQIVVKQNEMKLLQENEVLLKADTETQQRAIEVLKMELLTEQDDYDHIEKKLNEETEFISVTAECQEILTKQTKFFVEQVYKGLQFQETFEKEALEINNNYENMLQQFQENVDNQTVVLNSTIKKKIEISNTSFPLIEKIRHLGEQLNSRINEIEKMINTMNVVYYKQNAVLEYLKIKDNELLEENNILKCNLRDTDEQNTGINSKEGEFTEFEARVEMTNKDLLNIKTNYKVEQIYLGQLLDNTNIDNEIKSLEQEETLVINKLEISNNKVLHVNEDISQIMERINFKSQVKEDNCKLTEHLTVLEKDKNDLLTKINETTNLKQETKEICDDLVCNLEESLRQFDLAIDNTNNLNLKRNDTQNIFEERKVKNSNEMVDLDNQLCILSDEKCSLVRQLENQKVSLEANSKIGTTWVSKIQQMKHSLQENSNSVRLLFDEINNVERLVLGKQSQDEINFANLRNFISLKDSLKVQAEFEIRRLLGLHAQVVELVEECQGLYLVKQSDLKYLKERFLVEIGLKQSEMQCKKNELECLHKEKMNAVLYLNSDIVEAGRNEMFLAKRIQEIAHLNEKKKKELIVLHSALSTLDGKLRTIAKAVANLSQDKGSNVKSQSTMVSSDIGQPKPIKSAPKRRPVDDDDDDSSSSGVSLRRNDSKWKKEIIRRQQNKQMNYLRSQSSQMCSTDVQSETTLIGDNTKVKDGSAKESIFNEHPIPTPTRGSKPRSAKRKL